MPIKIQTGLPASEKLIAEGVLVIDQDRAACQDIRPLKIAILNLMPRKEVTEVQFARLLGASPLQIDLTLLKTASYTGKNTASSHLDSFYQSLDEVADQKFDGLIITGAPVEQMPFEDVAYWSELARVFDWSKSNVHSTFGVCWGAQAMLYHRHSVPKHQLPAKRFGIYRHTNLAPTNTIMHGLNDHFSVPVSRHTEIRQADLPSGKGLTVLAQSHGAGLCLLAEAEDNRYYMFNHLEYDDLDLHQEYLRDLQSDQAIDLPVNYYPDDDPSQVPKNSWRAAAHLLFGNWINQIYQTTPFDLTQIRQGY